MKNNKESNDNDFFSYIETEINQISDQKLVDLHKKHKGHSTPNKETLLKQTEEEFFFNFEKDCEKYNQTCQKFYDQLKIDNVDLYNKVIEEPRKLIDKFKEVKDISDLNQLNNFNYSEDVLRKVYEKGVHWFHDEHFDKSHLYFTFLSLVDSTNIHVWLLKGMNEQNLELYDDALSSYAIAISLNPTFLSAYIQTIQCLILGNHLDKAREVFDVFTHDVSPHEYEHNDYMKSQIEGIKEYLHQLAY